MSKELYKVLVVLSLTVFFSSLSLATDSKTGSAIGDYAPNFSVKSIDGKTFNLESLRGKVVLVNFWATWCAPCVVEMPSMQKAYDEITKENKNFEILAISIDNDQKLINKFLDDDIQQKIRFPILFDEGKKISSMYGTYQVPETYIVDKTGKITEKVIGIREWNESITLKYLKSLLPK